MTDSRPEWAPASTGPDQLGSARAGNRFPAGSTNSPEPMYRYPRDEVESLIEGFATERERAAQNPERYAPYAAVGTKPPVTTG